MHREDKIPHHTCEVNYVRMVLHCALQSYINSLEQVAVWTHNHLSVTEVGGVGGWSVSGLGGGGGASVDVGQQGPGAGQGHVDNQPGLQQQQQCQQHSQQQSPQQRCWHRDVYSHEL